MQCRTHFRNGALNKIWIYDSLLDVRIGAPSSFGSHTTRPIMEVSLPIVFEYMVTHWMSTLEPWLVSDHTLHDAFGDGAPNRIWIYGDPMDVHIGALISFGSHTVGSILEVSLPKEFGYMVTRWMSTLEPSLVSDRILDDSFWRCRSQKNLDIWWPIRFPH